MSKEIQTMKNYGKMQLKLNKLLEERGMTRNALARSVNTRFEVIDKWCNNQIKKVDLDILARICYVLDCNIDDIVEYLK